MDNSRILTFFNMKLDTFIIAVTFMTVVLIITLFFLLLDYLKIRKRYMEFMTGETGKNLEYTIYKRFRDIDELKIGQKDNDDQIEIIYDMVRKSYNKIGLYHYNAFNNAASMNGGSISFALALLNSSFCGFVLNVIHNRAGCHVYMKEIKDGTCETALAEEETIALNMAMNYDENRNPQDEIEETAQENIENTESPEIQDQSEEKVEEMVNEAEEE